MSASSDYLSTLSRLSEAKAAGQANAITAAAQAQAEATRANAGLWGNSIATIGQMVAQYPEQQARLQQIKNQAANTELERQRLQMQTNAARRAQAGEDQANQIIAALPRNSDGTYDTGALTQKLAAANVPLPAQEKLTTSIDNMNKVIASFNTSKVDHAADLANSILTSHAQGEPIDADAVHFGLAAAKAAGLANDQDEKQFTDLMAQGASPEQVLKSIRNVSAKYRKTAEPIKLGANEKLVAPDTFQTLASNITEKPTEASLAADLSSPDPAVRARAETALKVLKPPPTITPYEQEQLKRRDQELKLSQARLDLAIKNANKPAIAKETGGLVDAVIASPELWGQLTPTAKAQIAPALQAKGFTAFEKPPSATLENRLSSAKAVVQTGNDMIKQLKDPKIAAMLGPVMGRYNSVADFVGNPPPEFANLAGLIESYSLANMGVHGMRAASGAEAIAHTLGVGRHTPESIIAAIEGLNGFANHLLENEGRSVPPPSGPSGVPSVGSTFQGGKVLKVTRVP